MDANGQPLQGQPQAFTPEQLALLTQMQQQQSATMQQEIQTLQAQLAAATAAPPSSSTQPRRTPDQRLGRPTVFRGDPKDSSVMFPEFAFKLCAFMGLEEPDIAAEMKRLDDSTAVPKRMHELSATEQEANGRFYFSLVMLTGGQAAAVVRAVDDGNGLKAYANLVARCNPNTRGRSLGRLSLLLKPNLGTDMGKLMDNITAWEELIHQYEVQSMDKIADDIN